MNGSNLKCIYLCESIKKIKSNSNQMDKKKSGYIFHYHGIHKQENKDS